MRKESTMRSKHLNAFQKTRLAEQNAQIRQLEDLIKAVPKGIEIWQIQNEEGHSLLHHAAQSDQPVIVRRLLKVAKERIDSVEEYRNQDIMKAWTNKKSNSDYFIALHFAAFNGNLEICQMLIDEGSDIHALNSYGLNCLHFGAQGDQPSTLYFFHKVLKLDINSKDYRGSTPLHWAIFRMSELAMIYILAWLPQENLKFQDQEGYTAMHLAVKLAEKLESSRPVRVLLYHGAPLNIKDLNGNLPIDFAKNLENEQIRDQVVRILDQKTTLSQFLQLESPMKKVQPSRSLTIFYFVFQFFIYMLSYLFAFPLWQEPVDLWIVLSTQALATLFFLISINKAPGYVKPHDKVDFLVSTLQLSINDTFSSFRSCCK